jgi:hypothetical protein
MFLDAGARRPRSGVQICFVGICGCARQAEVDKLKFVGRCRLIRIPDDYESCPIKRMAVLFVGHEFDSRLSQCFALTES